MMGIRFKIEPAGAGSGGVIEVRSRETTVTIDGTKSRITRTDALLLLHQMLRESRQIEAL